LTILGQPTLGSFQYYIRRTSSTRIAPGAAVALGATVTDADTTAAGACTVAESQTLTYQWSFTQVPAGRAATLLSANTLNASFVPDVAGAYSLSLTATDPQGHF